MITGERILEVSGNKKLREPVKGLNINIALEDAKADGENLEIYYVYTASYKEGVGEIKIKGVLMAKEDKKKIKEILDTWKKQKRVPEDYAAIVLSAVNYSGSANGTLVARVLGLTAPLIPPRIQLSKAPGTGKKKK
jgi:heterodisulfide reductase subunit A-like polyferredoxin